MYFAKCVNNVSNDPYGMICHLTLGEALSNLFSDLGTGHVGMLPLVLHPVLLESPHHCLLLAYAAF